MDFNSIPWGTLSSALGVVGAVWAVGFRLINKFQNDISEPLRGEISGLKDEFKREADKRVENNKRLFSTTDELIKITGKHSVDIARIKTRLEMEPLDDG